MSGRPRNALYRNLDEQGAAIHLRAHGAQNPAHHRADDGRRAPALFLREPLSQHRVVRERAARGVYEEVDGEIGFGLLALGFRRLSGLQDLPKAQSLLTPKALSLNYLATRFTCSWPWSTMVLL